MTEQLLEGAFGENQQDMTLGVQYVEIYVDTPPNEEYVGSCNLYVLRGKVTGTSRWLFRHAMHLQ